MSLVYNTKKQTSKQNLITPALTLGLSSCGNSKLDYSKKDKGLQTQDIDIKKGALTFRADAPNMPNYVSHTSLSVNTELQIEFFQNRQKLTRFVNVNCNRPEARVFSFFVEKINCNDKKWTCSLEEIAKETGRSIKQTQNGIYGLRDLGVLKIKKKGFRERSTYSFDFTMFKSPPPNPPTATTWHIVCQENNKDIISKRNKSNNTYHKTNSGNILKEKKEFKIENWLPTGSALEKGLKETGQSYLKVAHHAEEMRIYCLNNPCKDGKPWTRQSMNYFFFLWLKKSLSIRSEYSNLIPYANRSKYNQNLKRKSNMSKEEIKKPVTYTPAYSSSYILSDNCRISRSDNELTQEEHDEYDKMIKEMLENKGIRL